MNQSAVTYFTRSVAACMVWLGWVLRLVFLWLYLVTFLTLLIVVMPLDLARYLFIRIRDK